jgi:polysaccharide biosynthesis transport protein
MDFGYLVQIILRRKWLILGAMATAAILTFVLIGMRPEQYRSEVTVSTGIINYKGFDSDDKDAWVQQYQVDNAFSNLMTLIKSRASIRNLTMDLLQHDMVPAPGVTPFRQPDKALATYTDEEFQKVVEVLKKLKPDTVLAELDPQTEFMMDKVARAYGYDNDALLRAMTVKRKAETDYLQIDMVAETPQVAMHMSNNFCKRFLSYYYHLSVREKRKNMEFYTQLAKEKKFVVDSIKTRRYGYLAQRGLPALGRQSEELVAQISEMESAKQQAESKLSSSTESVSRLQKYIDDRSSQDAGGSRSRVSEKSLTQDKSDKVRQLTQKSLDAGGKDPELEAELSKAKSEYEQALRSSARNLGRQKTTSETATRTKEDLYHQKVQADLDRIEAEKSLEDLNRRISSLTGKLSTYVVNDEVSTTLDADQQRAEKEFATVNEQLMNAKLSFESSENPLHIVEGGRLPEWPEPNRQALLSGFAGIVVGSLACILLFVLAYFDNTLKTPDAFKKQTNNLPLLGAINAIPVKGMDLQRIFLDNDSLSKYAAFKENLRKLRSGILLGKDHIFLIVSTKPKEGKTFAMHGLAYSLSANNKKVLMLDANFKSPLPAEYTEQATPNHALLNGILQKNGLTEIFREKQKTSGKTAPQLVDIIGNTGLFRSPAELLEPDQFRQFLNDLREHYDYIFMECAALNDYSDAHELLAYSDKVLAVFNAGSEIKTADRESLDFLRKMQGKFGGAILTGVDVQTTN